MSRFYVGQPVTCVLTRQEWMATEMDPDSPIPVKGQRYTVSELHFDPDSEHVHFIWLLEISDDWVFMETGFAPITEDRVRGIIAQAREVEDA